VGEVTARKLLRRFGSVAQLKTLTVDELLEEVPKAQAMKVYNALHGDPGPETKPADATESRP
jgi:excinuclease UvrABC nuclease subunit